MSALTKPELLARYKQDAEAVVGKVFSVQAWDEIPAEVEEKNGASTTSSESTMQKVLFLVQRKQLWFKEPIDKFLAMCKLPATTVYDVHREPFQAVIVLNVSRSIWNNVIFQTSENIIFQRQRLIKRAFSIFSTYTIKIVKE